MKRTAVVILAAGASRRLGLPKQLVQYQGKSLLENTIVSATDFFEDVYVVLGAHKKEILPPIAHFPIHILENTDWENGMSASIRLGIQAVQKCDAIEQVILTVCDQPQLTCEHFQRLIFEKEKTEKDIIASAYADIQGVPILFSKKYFSELRLLKGDKGARAMLYKHQEDVAEVYFPEGAWDIDTPADLEKIERE